MKYLIFGLGNIGIEYQNTRHNIGFKVLDAISLASNVFFTQERYAYRADLKYKGKTIILIKPTTYMNLSGKAVNYWLKNENIPIENSLTVVDDLAIPFGTIRIKAKGSAGGHNGLTNIIETLGHNNFARLRFGIGDEFKKGHQIDYVLSQWSKDEQIVLPLRIETMVEAIKSFATIGLERTMNFYNGK